MNLDFSSQQMEPSGPCEYDSCLTCHMYCPAWYECDADALYISGIRHQYPFYKVLKENDPLTLWFGMILTFEVASVYREIKGDATRMLSKIRRILEEKEPDFVEDIDKLKDCRIENIDAGFVNILNREAMFVAYIDYWTPYTLSRQEELTHYSCYIKMSLEEMERMQKEFEQE